MAFVRHKFTVDDWHVMGEIGLFGDNARVELLDGEVVDMSPIGSRHAGTINQIGELLRALIDGRGVVAVQNPVTLGKDSEPQPDVAVLVRRDDFYRKSHPVPEEIFLLIEVSDASLSYDRDEKAPRYAAAGVRETWVVDLGADQVLVMRSPSADGYRDVRVVSAGGVLEVEALEGVTVAVDELLGRAQTGS